jgi:SAM-dependent methyltransferase
MSIEQNASKRVLDIGCGSGGRYIKERTAPDEKRVGIDIDDRALLGLKRIYPEVSGVLGVADRLPFPDNTFCRIEIILPAETLAVPGLQRGHFALEKDLATKYREEYPRGYFDELFRVLQPGGEVVIFGDSWINPEEVKETVGELFVVQESERLSLDEFHALDTATTEYTSEEHGEKYFAEIQKHWEETLIKMSLKSTKEVTVALPA